MYCDYCEEELQEAYLSLKDEQKEVLDNLIKRGRKTKWLNAMAKQKGSVLTEEELDNPDAAMDKLIDWVLLDYVDAGRVDSSLRCECGKTLRHRFTVLHRPTGQIHHFGRDHLREHTGLDSKTVLLVTKGIKEINLEREEILSKIIDEWKLPFEVPSDLVIPKDMVNQLRVGLPLLDRQINRLSKKIYGSSKDNSLPLNIHSSLKLPPKSYASDFISKWMTEVDKPEPSSTVDTSNDDVVMPTYNDVDYKVLINKLSNATINGYEAKQLYDFVKANIKNLHVYNLSIGYLLEKANFSLGRISKPSIRKWLVELEYL